MPPNAQTPRDVFIDEFAPPRLIGSGRSHPRLERVARFAIEEIDIDDDATASSTVSPASKGARSEYARS
jgi:hypothetical protein